MGFLVQHCALGLGQGGDFVKVPVYLVRQFFDRHQQSA